MLQSGVKDRIPKSFHWRAMLQVVTFCWPWIYLISYFLQLFQLLLFRERFHAPPPLAKADFSLWDPYSHCYKGSWHLHSSAFKLSTFLIVETFEFSVAFSRFVDNLWSELSPQQSENNLIFGGFIAAVFVLLTSSKYKVLRCINLIYGLNMLWSCMSI